MRNLGRVTITLGVFWLGGGVGCYDHTFDLLPDTGGASAGLAGGSGRGANAGRGGRTNGGWGGGAGAGRTGAGGSNYGGTSGLGGAIGTAGCGHSGCGPQCASAVYGASCTPCNTDLDCDGLVCSPRFGCVECRLEAVPSDCPDGEICDPGTGYRCLPACDPKMGDADCPTSRPACDQSGVCRVCDLQKHPCPDGLLCTMSGECGECRFVGDTACMPDKPICNVESYTCEICMSDEDCYVLHGGPYACRGGSCVPKSSSP